MSNLFLHGKQSYIGFKRFSVMCLVTSGFSTFTSFRRSSKAEHKGLDKALKILDFVTPKTGKAGQDDCHQRLIQSMQDLLEIGQKNNFRLVRETARGKLTEQTKVTSNYSINNDISSCWSSNILVEEECFHELDKRSIRPDATVLSFIISSCGDKGALDTGLQHHAFSVKIGFYGRIPIGCSLISLYSKCGKLDGAYRVFQEMPVKNTVSWTAIIAAYAQHWQLETCLYLFNLMRHSNLKPNDFTYASLLSVCTNCASLALGRSFHCLEKRTGYDSYVHVSNALISMYAKCGVIEDANYVFERLSCKDVISWNSMIFGYSHYGIAGKALDLLKEMDRQNILPDAITFLGVLSSCRHAGLVDKGHHCFNLMVQHGIKPELGHYSCIVDLLGRAGLLEAALDFIEKMPIPPNAVVWGSLLSSCRVHGNVWIGIYAAEKRLLLEPGCATTHVQLANLYASIGRWNNVAKVRKLMKERELKTTPGYSWIEIGSKVHRFKAEDGTNTELKEMLRILDSLGDHMQCLRHML